VMLSSWVSSPWCFQGTGIIWNVRMYSPYDIASHPTSVRICRSSEQPARWRSVDLAMLQKRSTQRARRLRRDIHQMRYWNTEGWGLRNCGCNCSYHTSQITPSDSDWTAVTWLTYLGSLQFKSQPNQWLYKKIFNNFSQTLHIWQQMITICSEEYSHLGECRPTVHPFTSIHLASATVFIMCHVENNNLTSWKPKLIYILSDSVPKSHGTLCLLQKDQLVSHV
jgi:hypothetical protein